MPSRADSSAGSPTTRATPPLSIATPRDPGELCRGRRARPIRTLDLDRHAFAPALRSSERTLLSVLDQNYPAIEYFVQDGGSTDGTIDILGGTRTSSPAGHPNRTMVKLTAINRGVRANFREIMGWLNSDDLLLPGALACIGTYFPAHPEVDVVYGNRLMIDDEDGQIGAWILPPHDDLAMTLADFVPQETLFWRRSIWEAAGGGLDAGFGYALDWDLLLRFREAGAEDGSAAEISWRVQGHAQQNASRLPPTWRDRDGASPRTRLWETRARRRSNRPPSPVSPSSCGTPYAAANRRSSSVRARHCQDSKASFDAR